VSHRNWKFRLEDTIEALDRIFQYVEDLDYDYWLIDALTYQMTARGK
jgi:uncharacterized protein with HEPN domain